VEHCHLNDIEHDNHHHKNIKLLGGHQVVELLPPLLLGHVGCLIVWHGLQDKSLNVHPTQVLSAKSFLLFFLGSIKLHEEHTDEEIEEEEGSDQDEDNEENHVLLGFLLKWTFVLSHHIDGLLHDIWPSLQTGYDV
jgi:hypothetical protein